MSQEIMEMQSGAEETIESKASVYSDQTTFEEPVLLEGSGKVYVPNSSLVSLGEDADKWEMIQGEIRDRENELNMIQFNNLLDVHLEEITEEHVIFKHQDFTTSPSPTYFTIKVPQLSTNEDSAPFKGLCQFLGIPYGFVKKCPSEVNDLIFSHFTAAKKLPAEGKRKENRMQFLYKKDSYTLSTEKLGSVNAFEVQGVIKKIALIEEDAPSISHIDIEDGIPVIHKMVPAFEESFKNEHPDSHLEIKQIATGFDVTGKGRHFMKFTIKGGEFDTFKVGDDDFDLGFGIESDLLGVSSNSGQVTVYPMIYRLICENGMTAEPSAEDMEILKVNLIQKRSVQLGISTEDSEYEKMVVKPVEKAIKHMNSNGINVNVSEANSSNHIGETILEVINMLISSKEAMVNQMEVLQNTNFGAYEEADVVEAVFEASTDKKFVSPKAVKSVLIEYLLSNSTQSGKVSTAYDMLNLLTYLARAHDLEVMAEMERSAMTLMTAVAAKLTATEVNKRKRYEALKSRLITPAQTAGLTS